MEIITAEPNDSGMKGLELKPNEWQSQGLNSLEADTIGKFNFIVVSGTFFLITKSNASTSTNAGNTNTCKHKHKHIEKTQVQ